MTSKRWLQNYALKYAYSPTLLFTVSYARDAVDELQADELGLKVTQHCCADPQRFYAANKWSLEYTEKPSVQSLTYKHQTNVSSAVNLQFEHTAFLRINESESEETLVFYQRAALMAKWRLRSQLKLYGGVDYSHDGLGLVVGAKIAGFKILFPWTGVHNMVPVLDAADPNNTFVWPLIVAGSFLALAFGASRFAQKQRKAKISAFFKDELPHLVSKHGVVLRNISERAKQN